MRSAGRGASHARGPPPDVARGVHRSRAPGRGALLDELDAALALPQSKGPARMFVLDGESGGAGRERWGTVAVQRARFRRGDVGVPPKPRASPTTRRLRRRRGFLRGHFQRRRCWSIIRCWSGGCRRGGCGCVREGEDHMPRLFSFVSTEDGGGSGVEAYFHGRYLVLEATGGGGAGGGVQSRAPEEVGEGRDAVYVSLRLEALDVRRRGVLHQRARGGAAVHRRRARGDPQGDPAIRARLAGFLLRRNEPPGGDGGVTAAATTVRASRRAWPRVRLQRTDRRAARLAAQREGRDLRPGVRRERGVRIHGRERGRSSPAVGRGAKK